MQESERRPSVWPYTERSGVAAEQHVERLFAEPDFRLSDDERQEVTQFGTELMRGEPLDIWVEIPYTNADTVPPLEDVVRMSVLSSEMTFYPDCFSSVGIRWGEEGDIHTYLSNKVAYGEPVDKKLLRTAAVYSADWHKTYLADQLTQPAESDKDFEDLDKVVVNLDPDALLRKLEALVAHKSYCRQMHAALQEQDQSHANQAKQVVLDTQVARINNLIATTYPHAFNLARQLAASDDTELTEAWRNRLSAVTPVLRNVCTPESQPAEQTERFLSGFARRLDLLRFGAARGGQDGNFSAVSPELLGFVSGLETRTQQEDPEPKIPPQILEEMKAIRWKAPQFKAFLEAVLKESGLLSEHQAEAEEFADRNGPAEDGLWQVVITPERGSLFTGDAKRAMEVPAKFNRTLLQVPLSGALPIAAHEFAHVVQTRYDAALAEALPLAGIRGRRAIVGTEMGGLFEEREVFNAAGITRPTNTFYLRGLQAKQNGGNMAQVIRAVHLARKNIDPATATQVQRESSVGQALRLYRAGGHHSQPLDYLEQNLLMQALETRPAEEARAIGIAATSFAFEDSARLHAVDMLAIPDATSITNPADTVLRVYMDQFHGR